MKFQEGWTKIDHNTAKLQKTKQGNRNTIYSSLTSVLCRTLEATNTVCIKLWSNVTHMYPTLLPKNGATLPSPNTAISPGHGELSLALIHLQSKNWKKSTTRESKRRPFKTLLRPTEYLPPRRTLTRYGRAAIKAMQRRQLKSA